MTGTFSQGFAALGEIKITVKQGCNLALYKKSFFRRNFFLLLQLLLQIPFLGWGGGACDKAAQSPNSFATDIPKVLTAEQITGNLSDPPNLGLPMHEDHQRGIIFYWYLMQFPVRPLGYKPVVIYFIFAHI